MTACFMVERVEGDPPRFRRADTGETFDRQGLPPGAVWEAPWMGDSLRVNGTGPVLVVILPNGHEWMPGSRAGNCPHLKSNGGEWVDHDCWCVHGDPPNLTVDKQPEPGRTTCTAGSGSIQSADWHGFLRGGQLVLV